MKRLIRGDEDQPGSVSGVKSQPPVNRRGSVSMRRRYTICSRGYNLISKQEAICQDGLPCYDLGVGIDLEGIAPDDPVMEAQ